MSDTVTGNFFPDSMFEDKLHASYIKRDIADKRIDLIKDKLVGQREQNFARQLISD